MNIERLTELRDYLLAVPDERFDYSVQFSGSSSAQSWMAFHNRTIQYPCSTTGCVAGHACFYFGLHGGGPMRVAANHLGIDDGVDTFLFIEECEQANKSDAILRLNHLISGGTPDTYDWTQESWNKLETNDA